MFFGLELLGLQIYWWGILSLLGGLLVFMFFVQGGQGMLFELAKNEEERRKCLPFLFILYKIIPFVEEE